MGRHRREVVLGHCSWDFGGRLRTKGLLAKVQMRVGGLKRQGQATDGLPDMSD
jgi:hypothetical protein